MVFLDGPTQRMTTALESYCAAWRQQDWEAMHRLTQKTWAAKPGNTSTLLEEWHPKTLLSYTIGTPERIGQCMYRVPVTLSFANGEQSIITPHLICELAPYTPNLNGSWGINPISTLRTHPQSPTLSPALK